MNDTPQPRGQCDVITLGKVLAASGYFPDVKSAAQAVVKIMAAQELGFGPIAGLTSVHIVQGRVAIGAHLMAAAVKRSGRYDYTIVELSESACRIEFFEKPSSSRRDSVGTSVFTIEDARRAGLLGKDNWRQYPRNMLFARALSNGVRLFCPDVASCGPVYVPEELESNIEEEAVERLSLTVGEAQRSDAATDSEPEIAPAVVAGTQSERKPIRTDPSWRAAKAIHRAARERGLETPEPIDDPTFDADAYVALVRSRLAVT